MERRARDEVGWVDRLDREPDHGPGPAELAERRDRARWLEGAVETLSERFPYFRLRSALKPGLTGWAQIRHGYVNEVKGFEEKLALDLYYMKYRSLTMDLLILWQTVKTVILLRGI